LPTNHPDDHNDISTALTDIINELGSNPKGAAASVTARLDAIQAEIDAAQAEIDAVDGPIAVQARLAAIPKVQYGTIEGGVITTGTLYNVSFPSAFGSSTVRIAFGSFEDQYNAVTVQSGSVTASGFSAFVAPVAVVAGGSGSTIVRVSWIAVGTW
jgi:hypothetical protein